MPAQPFDGENATILLSHLARATKHHNEREEAHKHLQLELAQLKKAIPKTLQKRFLRLEHSIAKAIRTENRILSQHPEEKARTEQAQRIHELEQKLAKALEARFEQLEEIKQSINRAEKLYKKAAGEKKHPEKKLETIKNLLDKIKAKAKALEERSLKGP